MPYYRKVPGPKVIHITRDLAAAAGNVAVTGVGFKPSSVIAICALNGGTAQAFGFADPTTQSTGPGDTYKDAAGSKGTYGGVIPYLESAAGAYQIATVFSWDNDGITLAFAKAGAPTGIADINLKFWP